MSNDDDGSQLPETELEAIEDAQFETSTEATAGDITRADVVSERKRLDEMDAVAEGALGLPDARVRYLTSGSTTTCARACVCQAMVTHSGGRHRAKRRFLLEDPTVPGVRTASVQDGLWPGYLLHPWWNTHSAAEFPQKCLAGANGPSCAACPQT